MPASTSGVRSPNDARPLLRPRRRARAADEPPRPKPGAAYRPGQPIGYLSAAGSVYQKKYLTRKLGFFLLVFLPPIAVVTTVIVLVSVLWAIANHTLHVVQMQITEANLTHLTNDSFPLSLNGQSAKAGIFPATLYFRDPMDVYWMTPPPDMRELHLGRFPLGRVSVASGHGKVIQSTQFEILDQDAFAEFTKFMVSQPRFTWRLVCNNTHAEAFGFFPTFQNYVFKKHVNFNGINGFENVRIADFQLPGNDPAGGISMQTLTTLYNPSPFSVQLGYLNLGLYYKGMYIGPASTAGQTNVTTGTNTVLLVGRMIPQNGNETALGLLGELFTSYLNGEVVPVVANGVSTATADGDSVTWLTNGFQALSIKVPLQAPQPIGPIKSIEIDLFNIAFTKEDPWTPTAWSSNLKAQIGLPFGFSLNIVSTKNVINLMNNNSLVGTINGAYSNSTLTLDVLNAGSTAGILDLTLPPSPLVINDTMRDGWTEYEKALVFGDGTSTRLKGSAVAVTDTPIGRVVLNGIDFDVLSGLRGLQGLRAYPTTISGLDVMSGGTDALQLSVNTTIINPSNLNLSTGDVTFNLVNEQVIGTVTMPNLNLQLGQNNVTAASEFRPKSWPTGMDTLNRYVQGLDTVLYIDGTSNTSTIPSLGPTMELMRLNATLPGLPSLLITQSWLTVPQNIDTNNTVGIKINLANPFTASMDIKTIDSAPVYQNLTLGQIKTTMTPPIHGPGHTNTVSVDIPMQMDTRPKTLVTLLFMLADVSNTTLGPWPPFLNQILAMNDTEINTPVRAVPSPSDPTCPAQGAFDLQGAMLTALKALDVKIPVVTDVSIEQYDVSLNFSQNPVPVVSDNTSLYLLGPAGAPLIQKIVNDAQLSFNQGNITHVTNDGFDVALAGQMLTDAPTNAVISFPEPIEIRWQGAYIATITLPPICTIPGQGVPDYHTAGHVNIVDQDGFTRFTTYILHNQNFTWDISSPVVNVLALGITYTNVTLAKSVSFQAFNGLPGVLANNFNIPSEGDTFLNVQTDSFIPSPATLGIEMNTANFNLFFMDTNMGTLQANDLTLAPAGITKSVLIGQLTRQETDAGLNNLGVMFSDFLQGKNLSLIAQGVDVVTPYQNGSVSWLSAAFSTLNLSATLEGKIYTIIYSIQLLDLTLQITDDPAEVTWNIPVSNKDTVAMYANPFHFTLLPTQASVATTIVYEGVNTAQLNLPMLPADAVVSTGPETHSPLSLSFNNQRLVALDHDQFGKYLAAATDTPGVNFGLVGNSTVVANTHIGTIQIAGMPLNVSTNLPGINSFDHTTQLSNVHVDHTTPQYIAIPLGTSLHNPSNVTLHTRDLYLPVFYKGTDVGRAYVTTLDLFPGDNIAQAEFRYSPADPNDKNALEMMGRYLNPDNNGAGGSANPMLTPLVVGTQPTENEYPVSPYDSLLPALYGTSMNTTLVGLGSRLLLQMDLIIPALTALFDSKGTAILTIKNPLKTAMYVERIISDVWQGGNETGEAGLRATVNTTLDPPVTIPSFGVNTVNVTFVMTRGLLLSLDLLTQPLSISSVIKSGLEGGYEVPALPYSEYEIYTTYDTTVLGLSINITSAADLLEGIIGVLTPAQIQSVLEPVLSALPLAEVQAMAHSLNLNNPVVQFACTTIPVLQGLPPCQLGGGNTRRNLAAHGWATDLESAWAAYNASLLPSRANSDGEGTVLPLNLASV